MSVRGVTWALWLHCKWQRQPCVSDNNNVIFICAVQNEPFYDVHAARAGFRNVSSLEVKHLMSIILVFLGQLLQAPKQWHLLPLRLLPLRLPHAGLRHGDRAVSLQTRRHRAAVQPLRQPLRWGHRAGLRRYLLPALLLACQGTRATGCGRSGDTALGTHTAVVWQPPPGAPWAQLEAPAVGEMGAAAA